MSEVEKVEKSERFRVATFRWLPDTWRSIADPVTPPVTKGDLLAYLSPIEPADVSAVTPGDRQPRRVIDRPDLQLLLPFPEKQYA